MIKFKYVGSISDSYEYKENKPVIGQVYDSSECVGLFLNTPVIVWASLFPDEWEEITYDGSVKLIKEVIKAIENGKVSEDHRGKIYTQEFGQSFLDKLKNSIK